MTNVSFSSKFFNVKKILSIQHSLFTSSTSSTSLLSLPVYTSNSISDILYSKSIICVNVISLFVIPVSSCNSLYAACNSSSFCSTCPPTKLNFPLYGYFALLHIKTLSPAWLYTNITFSFFMLHTSFLFILHFYIYNFYLFNLSAIYF